MLISLLLFVTGIANAQSLVQKFAEQTFVLSDTFKSPDGYYFGYVSYNLAKGSFLMINAEGPYGKVNPRIIVKGPIENGTEAIPTMQFLDTAHDGELHAVFIINKTGSYNIIIANGIVGNKGTIRTKMGLGSMDWLNNTKILPATNNTPFTLALTQLLRHAIFNFNFIKGENDRTSFGRNYKNNFRLPGADMESPYTCIRDYLSGGCIYLMGEIDYKPLPKKKEDDETLYDQKDSIIGIKKYDSLKSVLLSILSTDFVIEREEKFKLNFERDTRQDGRRIIFTHKEAGTICDPADYIPELIASKKIKVELSLELWTVTPKIFLKIYSEEK